MLIHADFFSKELWRNTELYIALPSPNSGEYVGRPENTSRPEYYVPGHKWPTLILFHCNFGGANEWVRFTSIERYAQHYRMAVVMPDIENSGGMDMVHGSAFHTYLSQELPALLQATFPLSLAPDELFVGGASFGGYAANYWALHQPERFAGVINLSSMLNFPFKSAKTTNQTIRQKNPLSNIFPDPEHLEGTDYDLYRVLAENLTAGRKLPRWYTACGEQDYFYEYCKKISAKMKEMGLDVTSHYGPGRHTWAFWDAEIDRAMAWMTGRNMD